MVNSGFVGSTSVWSQSVTWLLPVKKIPVPRDPAPDRLPVSRTPGTGATKSRNLRGRPAGSVRGLPGKSSYVRYWTNYITSHTFCRALFSHILWTLRGINKLVGKWRGRVWEMYLAFTSSGQPVKKCKHTPYVYGITLKCVRLYVSIAHSIQKRT